MTDDQKDHALADCLEAYHRQRARGERPDMDAFREQLGDDFGEFEELLLAETAIDQALEGQAPEKLPKTWGPYTLVAELGRGAAGVVYEALHRKLGRKVALKVLRTGIDTDDTARERFNREAQALAQVRHDHIVDLFEFGDVEGRPYYAMELVEGPTLADLVRRGEAPEPHALCAGLAGIADALQALHAAGIIHRDVKPSNIMLAPNGRYMLADFGLARTAAATTVTRTGDALGTPLYMSPEQMLGKREEIEARTDVYGFGATLYQALTGQPPFRTENLHALMRMVLTQRPEAPRTVKPDLPRDCGAIAMKCLEKEPGDRYESAGALAADLRAFAAGEHVSGRPLTRTQRGRRWLIRHPAYSAAALLLAAVGAHLLLQPPEPATLTLEHQPEVVVARARVDHGAWLPMPVRELPVEPDTPHEVEVEAPDGGFGVWTATVRGRPGAQIAKPVLLPWVDLNHPNVTRALFGLGKLSEDRDIKAPADTRDARVFEPRGPPLQLLFPRGKVRPEDLAQWQVHINELFEGHGLLVFRQGETTLATQEFPEPTDFSTFGDMPEVVVEAARSGKPITWTFKHATTPKITSSASFQLVVPDDGFAASLENIESVVRMVKKVAGESDEDELRKQRIARATLRAKLYLQYELPQAAFEEVAARVAAGEDTLPMLLLQKRAVEILFPRFSEREDSVHWRIFSDRWTHWSVWRGVELKRFREQLEALQATPAADGGR